MMSHDRIMSNIRSPCGWSGGNGCPYLPLFHKKTKILSIQLEFICRIVWKWIYFTTFVPIKRLIMEDVNRIKLVLVEKKRTNKWLSDQMGVTPSTVSKWCTNSSQPDLPSLLKIADLLEVDIKELIVREYKKFLVSQELTKEARAEGKIACTMPCKEEEDDSCLQDKRANWKFKVITSFYRWFGENAQWMKQDGREKEDKISFFSNLCHEMA